MASNERVLPVIRLIEAESKQALDIGRRRHESSESRGYRQSDGSSAQNGLINHQRGAAAEIAVSKYLSIPWDATVDGYQSVADIANLIEVRSRTGARPYLRLKRDDQIYKGGRPFVSVERLGGQSFQIDGWIEANDGMKDCYFVPSDPDSRKPEWHVPIGALHSPESLEETLTERLGDRYRELRIKS